MMHAYPGQLQPLVLALIYFLWKEAALCQPLYENKFFNTSTLSLDAGFRSFTEEEARNKPPPHFKAAM